VVLPDARCGMGQDKRTGVVAHDKGRGERAMGAAVSRGRGERRGLRVGLFYGKGVERNLGVPHRLMALLVNGVLPNAMSGRRNAKGRGRKKAANGRVLGVGKHGPLFGVFYYGARGGGVWGWEGGATGLGLLGVSKEKKGSVRCNNLE